MNPFEHPEFEAAPRLEDFGLSLTSYSDYRQLELQIDERFASFGDRPRKKASLDLDDVVYFLFYGLIIAGAWLDSKTNSAYSIQILVTSIILLLTLVYIADFLIKKDAERKFNKFTEACTRFEQARNNAVRQELHSRERIREDITSFELATRDYYYAKAGEIHLGSLKGIRADSKGFYEDLQRLDRVIRVFDSIRKHFITNQPGLDHYKAYYFQRLRSMGNLSDKGHIPINEHSSMPTTVEHVNALDGSDVGTFKQLPDPATARTKSYFFEKEIAEVIKENRLGGIPDVFPILSEALPERGEQGRKPSALKGKANRVNRNEQRMVESAETVVAIPPEDFFFEPRIVDWIKIAKSRKFIGDAGEQIAMEYECNYLLSIGRDDLASRVRHVSIERGDGAGYDILSFFEDGREKYIEVKSTSKNTDSYFILSRNEVAFIKNNIDQCFIYRVTLGQVDPNTGEVQVYSADQVLASSMEPVAFRVKMKHEKLSDR